ncbi:hypothetical protein H0E87_024036 [Populus deltoides]|jgi:hypothetical protein|uniref:Uncharacterized protein n=1 Tax=Populus deltoides TaxID=3696 RepID=A0A8T2X729_POPDE|nr:hypothetical protein H0E87_024036 [Populus deltoides]
MKNTERWRIEKETREAIKNLIRSNSSVKENSKSILSLLMSSYKINQRWQGRDIRGRAVEDIVNESKKLYFAGKGNRCRSRDSGTSPFSITSSMVKQGSGRSVLRLWKEGTTSCREELPVAERSSDLKIVSLIPFTCQV